MLPDRLRDMPQYAIGFDLETDLIQPGLKAPPPVLGSAAELGPDGKVHGTLLSDEGAYSLFKMILDNPRAILVGANVVFDVLVEAVFGAMTKGEDLMPKIFAMYDPNGTIIRGFCDGRVFELQLAEPLHAIAQGHLKKHALTGQPILSDNGRPGRYSLKTVVKEVLDREDAKINDIYRNSYFQFRPQLEAAKALGPQALAAALAALPFQARQYPVDDAVNTAEAGLAQAGHLPSAHPHEWVNGAEQGRMYCRYCKVDYAADAPMACMRKQPRRNLHDLANQAYFAWAAHLGAAWGFHIPQDEVDKLEARVDAQREAAAKPFRDAGILKPEEQGGGENRSVLKRLIAVAYGARDLCRNCAGTCKVDNITPSGKKSKINCKECDGTGLELPSDVPRSEAGGISFNRDVLCESGDDLLMSYGEQPSKKIKTTYIPMLRKGRACNVCGGTGVDTKYTPGHKDWCTAKNGEAGYRPVPFCINVDPLKDTGRASIEDGFHGMPRKGGVRECVVARPGYVFSSEDWKAGELVTLAQACLELVGHSRLADALNNGLDPHLALAGTIVSKPYDEMERAKKAKEKWLDDLRQVGKKTNFGMGGGMAELEFILKPCRADPDLFTKCANGPAWHNYGSDENPKWERGFHGCRPCILVDHEDYCGRPGEKTTMYNDRPCPPVCIRCLRVGKQLREGWFRTWPEMRDFFKVVKDMISVDGPSGTPEMVHLGSLRVRGGIGFCDGANGIFQGALADAAKYAFCQAQRECVDRSWRVRSSEMMRSKFDGGESPLYGSRAIALFHDEIIAEHPESVAPWAAERVSEIMVEALRWKCPRLFKAVEAKPTIMRRLYKGAEPVYKISGTDTPANENDILVCWEPKKRAA